MNTPMIHAPDFSFIQRWLNSSRPIAMRELRGQVVILDFWTYCCVNCMHVLPVLRDLEERHREDPLVVIGVHSAKFDAEKDAGHISAAMSRYGVSHPVAVDEQMEVWSRYAIRSWPTLVIVRPDGTLAAVAPGEPDPDLLEAFVAGQLAEAREKGTLARAPLRFEAAAPDPAAGPLSWPGKALAAADGRVFVSDSGNHRVLVFDAGGRCLASIGSGLRGQQEGPFEVAALDDPQGLALAGDALYVADARAHVIWKADLATQTVSRLAGTGELGGAPLSGVGPAAQTALRSPWDLALRGDSLYVALAGSHQLATIDLRAGTVALLAGNGREALEDGPALQGALAQPSGLSLSADGATLYVADSESSAVRALDLATGTLRTLTGGPGLFDFGDGVGHARPGLLQHPLAVLATPDGVLVADTYNDKLKRLVLTGDATLPATVQPFFAAAGALRLAQPAGLSRLPSGEVLVADTNQHRLLRVRPDGSAAEPIELRSVPQPRRGAAQPLRRRGGEANARGWFSALLEAPAGVGLSRGAGGIVLEVRPPPGFELAAGSPWSAQLEVSRRSDLLELSRQSLGGESAGGDTLQIRIDAHARHEVDLESELLVSLRSVACDAVDHAACFPVHNHFRVPLRLLREGQSEVRFALPLELPAQVQGARR